MAFTLMALSLFVRRGELAHPLVRRCFRSVGDLPGVADRFKNDAAGQMSLYMIVHGAAGSGK